jgi:hypothetical protein
MSNLLMSKRMVYIILLWDNRGVSAWDEIEGSVGKIQIRSPAITVRMRHVDDILRTDLVYHHYTAAAVAILHSHQTPSRGDPYRLAVVLVYVYKCKI